MGSWGALPWENDDAADWFSDFMKETNIRPHVMRTVHEEIDETTIDAINRIRAAISIFIMLGRNYVWPIDNYDNDLEVIYYKALELRDKSKQFQWKALGEQIDREIAELETRFSKNIADDTNETEIIEKRPGWMHYD